MGSDELVERLRAKQPESDGPNGIFMVPRNPEGDAAADEIERLTAQLAEAREIERAARARYPDTALIDPVRGYENTTAQIIKDTFAQRST